MTIEELSIRITAEADEALDMLDTVTERLGRLDGLLGQPLRLALDATGAPEAAALLEEQLTSLQARLAEQSGALAEGLRAVLYGLSDALMQLDGGLAASGAAGMQERLTGLAGEAENAGQAAAGAARQLDDLTHAGQEASRQAQSYRTALQGVSSRLEQLGRQRSAVSGLRDMRTQLTQSSRSAGDLQNALRSAERGILQGVDSVHQLEDSFHHMGDGAQQAGDMVTVNAQSLYGQLGGVIAWAQNAADSLHISGSVSVDTSGAVGQLNQLISVALAAQSILAGLGVSTGGAASFAGVSGGGGGGGGRSEEEEAAEAAERARQEAIRRDYELIEHQRHMNEITLEEEVALLEQMRQRHQMTAEEIMDWEERVYDVQQEMRRRDEESLNRLTQGVVEALTARYEAMRDAEVDRLDQSRRAWETWRDDSVRAIEEQIAALDKLAEAEQREDQDEEELRRIEKLKQEIAYEQDAYNRMKLEEQLSQAMKSREERLRRQELEDQKAALEEQAALIEQQAQQELDRLDQEEAAVEEAYAQRLSQAALEAEAEQLLMANNQQEILALLNTYAPQYDQLGRTMGERLLEGFQSTVGNVVDWFEALTGQLAGAQDSLMQSISKEASYARGRAVGAASGGAGVSIQQSVTFNQPVESPGDVARRMESVNQALGQWMSQEG